MTVPRFVKESATPGPFHDVLALYAQANLLQIMQGTACNALHGVKQFLPRGSAASPGLNPTIFILP